MSIKVDAKIRAEFIKGVAGVDVDVGGDRIRSMCSGGRMFFGQGYKTNNGQTLFRFHVERRFLGRIESRGEDGYVQSSQICRLG